MQTSVSRQQALALLHKYNAEPFHIQHALTVEGVMDYFACLLYTSPSPRD